MKINTQVSNPSVKQNSLNTSFGSRAKFINQANIKKFTKKEQERSFNSVKSFLNHVYDNPDDKIVAFNEGMQRINIFPKVVKEQVKLLTKNNPNASKKQSVKAIVTTNRYNDLVCDLEYYDSKNNLKSTYTLGRPFYEFTKKNDYINDYKTIVKNSVNEWLTQSIQESANKKKEMELKKAAELIRDKDINKEINKYLHNNIFSRIINIFNKKNG